MNLMKTTPINHRQLFDRNLDNSRTAKTTFTLEDLWNYYNISFMGNGDSLGASQFTTRTEIEKRKAALIAQVPPILPKQEEVLLLYCEKFGLEAVLFAIDEYSGGGSDMVPSIEGLMPHLKEAQATIANIERQSRMGY